VFGERGHDDKSAVAKLAASLNEVRGFFGKNG
jgi:hypothetical protein